MSKPSIGWLPYGSDDESVVFRCSFKDASEINTTDMPFATISVLGSGTQTHDPVKGMLRGSSGGYDMVGLTGDADLINGFQITYEVERSLLAVDGDAISSIQRACLLPGGGGTIGQLLGSKALDSPIKDGHSHFRWLRNNNYNSTTDYIQINSEGNDEFVRVNIGVFPGHIVTAIDGKIYTAGPKPTKLTAADLDRWYFDSYPDHYIRNFQVSSKVPVFPVIPALSSVMIYGDSYVGTTDLTLVEYNTITGAAYTEEYVYLIERRLEKDTLFAGNLYGYTHGGYPVNQDGANHLYTDIQAALLKNPTIFVFHGGVNDARQSTLSASFDADLKTLITDVMASDSVEYFFMPTIPNFPDGAYEDNVAEVNRYINALPAWWDAANPGRAGRVKIPDVNSALGGVTPNSVYFSPDEVHPSITGYKAISECLVNAIIEALNTQ